VTAWVVRAVPGLQNPFIQRLASAVIGAILLKKNGIKMPLGSFMVRVAMAYVQPARVKAIAPFLSKRF